MLAYTISGKGETKSALNVHSIGQPSPLLWINGVACNDLPTTYPRAEAVRHGIAQMPLVS